MNSLKEIVFFDTETTSPKPETTRVVQIAAVSYNLETHERNVLLNTLCKPGDLQISDGAKEVHGISNEDVADKVLDTEYMAWLGGYLQERKGTVGLGGHNSLTFDEPILWRLAGIEPFQMPHLDTLVCATRALPQAPNHKLSGLTEYLKLGSTEQAHDALADINMVIDLATFFSEKLGKSFAEMAAWCLEARVLSVCHFGSKHKGKLWGRAPEGSKNTHVPYFFAKWVCENFTSPSPDMVATMRYHYNLTFACLKETSNEPF